MRQPQPTKESQKTAKFCKDCRFLVSGECEANRMPMDGESEPCERFKLREPVKTYGDVLEKHRRAVERILVSANGESAVIVLKHGGGIKADSPADADRQLDEIEGRKYQK